jgi:hypothetical protein
VGVRLLRPGARGPAGSYKVVAIPRSQSAVEIPVAGQHEPGAQNGSGFAKELGNQIDLHRGRGTPLADQDIAQGNRAKKEDCRK